MIAANFVVISGARPILPSGLRNLGPTLREWRQEWSDRLDRQPADQSPIFPERDQPGLHILQQPVRLDRPVAYDHG